MQEYLSHITLLAVINFVVIFATLPWILTIKKNSTAAIAWCLIVIFLPLFGFFLWTLFGYNYVHRPLRRRRRHRILFRANRAMGDSGIAVAAERKGEETWQKLGRFAERLGAFPASGGNHVMLYHETKDAFEAMFDAVRKAEHHVHLEYFIIQADKTGNRFTELLVQKAKQGVEVRLLYDAIGSMYLRSSMIRPLVRAGGRCRAFLPVNPLRRRFQINMRNHRKMTIVDGRIAFTGGINIGDEYLGKDPSFGYWRDEYVRLEGPAVPALQQIFAEDWDFAFHENLKGVKYFPRVTPAGDAVVQVVESGPDQETNTLREIVFAAIANSRERLWIATPYLVPDHAILDALRMASHQGVDVRLLVPEKPDHWLPFFAGRYYWTDLMAAGAKVYQYKKGMMHAKIMMVDEQWGWVGSANLDNRSLQLNFEITCIFHSKNVIQELEETFRNDLKDSERVDAATFAKRSYAARLAENASRLFSPVL